MEDDHEYVGLAKTWCEVGAMAWENSCSWSNLARTLFKVVLALVVSLLSFKKQSTLNCLPTIELLYYECLSVFGFISLNNELVSRTGYFLVVLVCAYCYCCTHAGMADTSLFIVTFCRKENSFKIWLPCFGTPLVPLQHFCRYALGFMQNMKP